MQITLSQSVTSGKIKAIASKSSAHRLLICAAFANSPTTVRCEDVNEDITATVDCLCALGASIERCEESFVVTPIKEIKRNASLPCNESGSTLRFMLPICASLGGSYTFLMNGRLPSRPLSPLKEVLEAHGATITKDSENTLTVSGVISGDTFEIAGDVSSQFITGLLFALSFMKKSSTLKITTKLESAPYIDITVDALSSFGINISKEENTFIIPENTGLCTPNTVETDGDWSNAAFPLALGVIGKKPISVSKLSEGSKQGDRAIVDILRSFGAKIECDGDIYTAHPSNLCGTDIDASQIPDLVPILATVATVAEGQTKIYSAARLRLKESDRLAAVSEVLSSLGANIYETDDGLIINGKPSLTGGCVDSFGDHRIAMSVAVASVVCNDKVTVTHAEAVNKSYPAFWRDLSSLGAIIENQT
ncbi:MAG: 3-phosphoshikimate 1-carboxyvinyltransferase [Clostridia bacterium]|nr:3-phosphoshikimate 1-carboxyvinyltransferase [Clostridia bacterium]